MPWNHQRDWGCFHSWRFLPDFEDVISGMCKAADSYIQQKINEVHNQVLNEVNNIGGGNLLQSLWN